MKSISIKARRRLVVISFLMIIIVGIIISTSYNDWKQIFDNKNESKVLENKYENLLSEETALESEVTKLQDPDYVARYAREKFMYSKDGEIIIRITE